MHPKKDISTIYNDLRQIQLSPAEIQIIPKGGVKLKTVSWGTAVNYAKAYDPSFEYKFGEIVQHPGKDGITCSTTCYITLCGHQREQFYPVNDKKYDILYNPTAQEINDSIVRAIPKALAMHFGLFAYLYSKYDTAEALIKSTSAFSASIKNTVPTNPNDEGAGVTIANPFSDTSITGMLSPQQTDTGADDLSLSIIGAGFGTGMTYFDAYGGDLNVLKQQIQIAKDCKSEAELRHYKCLIATYKRVADGE